MKGKKTFGITAIIFCSQLTGQTQDSIQLISEVQIEAYQKPTAFIGSTKSVMVAPTLLLQQNSSERLLESINLLPGAKMEERSPGSYRLAIRGSSLRSPFGVRNVKIYFDDFIITDASGGSYLNAIDPSWIQNMEIYKGPESGDFGSITGGTMLFKTSSKQEQSLGFTIGSYKNIKQNLSFKKTIKNHFLQVMQSYQSTDSYREQSALERKGFIIKDQWNYKRNHQLNTFILFSNTAYETPGGLTLAQMMENRRQSRPKTATLPSTKEQQTGIDQKYTLVGLSHTFPLTSKVTHFALLQGSYMDFKNPFITNFEKRFENNWGARTYFNYENNFSNSKLETRLGFEGQLGKNNIRNYDNNSGSQGNPQNFDEIKTQNSFFFINQKFQWNNRLNIDASLAYQNIQYEWKNQFPTLESDKIKLNNQWLPNIGISYKLDKTIVVRGKLGKGSSAPTIDELRSSTQQINTQIVAEQGWNKEIGIRKQLGKILYAEISLFDFRFNDAIVRQQNEQGQEYFINSGKTKQQGVEFLIETRPIETHSNIINSVTFWASGNLFDFTFEDYFKDGKDYSGNRITGVPKASLQNVIRIKLFQKLDWDISHYYNSKTPLTDANSVFGEAYWLGNMNFSYPIVFGKIKTQFNLQIQNIYNTNYVAGFDINAFGNRFYNPAAKRNFNFGVQASF